LYYGEDFSAFQDEVDRYAVRREFGFPENALVIGHVGSFSTEQKNHSLLVKIAAYLVRMDSRIRFLLVGDGRLRRQIEEEVVREGIDKEVVFAGVRSDIPRLMLGAMDLFLFPSLFEGLGLVLIEAQAAGLPCLCSDVIPEEAEVVQALIKRLPLSTPPSEWARVALGMISSERGISPNDASRMVEASRFNILGCVRAVEEIYAR
jgi:glycosyltransferase involved in cell wall biosynthesis